MVVVAFEVVGAVESVELEQEPATAETKIAQAPIHKTRPVEVIPGCIGGLYRDPKKGGGVLATQITRSSVDRRVGSPERLRTAVTALRGRCPGPLDDGARSRSRADP